MKLLGPNGEIDVDIPSDARLVTGAGFVMLVEGDSAMEMRVARDGLNVWVSWRGYSAMFSLPELDAAAGRTEMRAPMTGRVVSIAVAVGDEVRVGQTVAVLEAMKMEYRLEAELDGEVEEIGADPGDLVDLGQLLVRLR